MPNEGCGVFLQKDKIVFYPCRNASETPEKEFLIDPIDWIKAQLSGVVIGIVHSHPTASAQPSEFDKLQAKQFKVPYHIISMVDYEMETV